MLTYRLLGGAMEKSVKRKCNAKERIYNNTSGGW